MIPVLFSLGGVTVYTYGLFAVMAVFWFAYIAWRHLKLSSYKEALVFDLLGVAAILALVAGRVVYVLFNLQLFVSKGFIAFFAFHLYPGINDFFAILVFGITFYILARNHKLKSLEIMAHFTVAMCVYLSIVSFGSMLGGVDVGRVTDFPFRLKYSVYEGLRHVVGLYKSAYFIVAAVFLQYLTRWMKEYKYRLSLVVALCLWLIAFCNVLFYPLTEPIQYVKNRGLLYFDFILYTGTMLTSIAIVLYDVRTIFFKFRK